MRYENAPAPRGLKAPTTPATLLLLLFLFLLLAPAPARARQKPVKLPSPEKVVGEYVKAVGGRKSLAAALPRSIA